MMSDDDNAAWNGLKRNWKSLKHKLLCQWHVDFTVKRRCLGTQSKVQIPVHGLGTSTVNDTNACVRHSQWSYGSPIRDLFAILMKEKDKDAFYNTLVEVFRWTLKQYGQEKLLNYFEK